MAISAKNKGFAWVMVALAASTCLAQPAYADDLRQQLQKKRGVEAAKTLGAPPVEAEPIKPGLAGSFLSGRFAKQNQDISEAAKYVNETLARDPGNERLQHEAMRLNLLAGNVPEATNLAHTLAASSGMADPLVACLLMLEQVNAGDYAGAQTTIAAAPEQGLFGLIRPVLQQWLKVASGESKTIAIQPSIDKAGFFAPFLAYHSALMNDVVGNVPAAEAAYVKTAADPATAPYRVIEAYANFLLRQNKPEQAQALFDAYAKANPSSSLIPDTLVAANVAPLVPDAKSGIAELFFTTASILFGDNSTQDTFLYLRIALELRQDMPAAQLMLANLYEQTGDYDRAITAYDSIHTGTVFYRRGQIRKALNLEALGKKEDAVALLDDLAKRIPGDASPLITKGDMLREAEKYDAAVESYSAAIARTEPLSANDWPLLYARGISYERAGNWEMAELDFKRALQLSPEQPDVLNYLAYSWLTMNKNLSKAREYLEKASAARPDDAHILDSVGWAYYLSGEYEAAVAALERAIDMMPDDVTVNEHLGDAYWRVGRQIEARYQWERALNFKPGKDDEAALRDKLANGLAPVSSNGVAAVPPSTQTP